MTPLESLLLSVEDIELLLMALQQSNWIHTGDRINAKIVKNTLIDGLESLKKRTGR